MNLSKISNIVFEDIDHSDFPDFCDAIISYAEVDGMPLTQSELDKLNENRMFVYDKLMDYLY